MSKAISIMDEDYIQWIKEVAARYHRCQIKASIQVNREMLMFYWDLGREIVLRHAENQYGSKFYASMSRDLCSLLPNVEGLSERNIRYCKTFYLLYSQVDVLASHITKTSESDTIKENLPQVVAELKGRSSFMDKCKGDTCKAWFFVNKIINDGWSRAVLLNFIDTNLYERQGAATTNFSKTLPSTESDLAQEITRYKINNAPQSCRNSAYSRGIIYFIDLFLSLQPFTNQKGLICLLSFCFDEA